LKIRKKTSHEHSTFAPDEVNLEQALQVGEELCDRLLKGNYQYVFAVHTDKNHLHCHIIFNNTNLYNGLSFTTEENQGKVSKRSWAKLRVISDEICQEHGLSVIAELKKEFCCLKILLSIRSGTGAYFY